jgi:hypothetical protein
LDKALLGMRPFLADLGQWRHPPPAHKKLAIARDTYAGVVTALVGQRTASPTETG